MGFDHITHGEVIRNHTTIFVRELLVDTNPEIQTPQSFSSMVNILHRKKFKICFSEKVIDILGPYLASGKKMMPLFYFLSKKENSISKWSDKNDILVLDRGFGDSLDIMNSMCLRSESGREKGQKQQFVSEANASRLVTKIRCAVESANGRLKRWKFLANIVSNTQIIFNGDYVLLSDH